MTLSAPLPRPLSPVSLPIHHQDVFDYLDVSHFPVLLNNYFSALAPVEELSPEQANELKRQVLSYAKEIKTIRDPLSHPGTRRHRRV